MKPTKQLEGMHQDKRRTHLKKEIKALLEKNAGKSRKRIYEEDVREEYKIFMSQSCYYKYLRELGCKRMNGKYSFKKIANPTYLDFLLTYEPYNRYMTYIIKDPSLGTLIARILNLNSIYSSDAHDYHCVVNQDMLICFFYCKSPAEFNEHSKKIRFHIKDILEKNYLGGLDV